MKFYSSFLIFLFTFHITSFAQNIDSIRYVLDSASLKKPFFGNILITKNNKTIYEKSYGFADAKNNIPLTKENAFQVASISKQFTAYGIMLLKNKGLLNYDSLVNKYIPTFPYNNITIRNLLTHTSGLPDFWNIIRPHLDTTKSNGNSEMLNYLTNNKLPLQFSPRSRFAYADIGYDLLATVIENISGLSYQEYMNKNIFQPLKMKNTCAYMVTDIRKIKNKKLAIGHIFENKKFEYAHLLPKYSFVFYLGDFYGDGSIVTRARDLAKWDKALRNFTLLPPEIQNEAFEGAIFNDKTIYMRKDVRYGFGWMLKDDSRNGKMAFHTGAHPGNQHVIYRLVEKDITLIFLSNSENPDINKLRNRLLELL